MLRPYARVPSESVTRTKSLSTQSCDANFRHSCTRASALPVCARPALWRAEDRARRIQGFQSLISNFHSQVSDFCPSNSSHNNSASSQIIFDFRNLVLAEMEERCCEHCARSPLCQRIVKMLQSPCAARSYD